MAPDRVQHQASRSAADAAKDEFVVLYVTGHRDRAAGIGVNGSGDEWAVKVFVESKTAAAGLPKKCDGLDVEINVVGKATALHGATARAASK